MPEDVELLVAQHVLLRIDLQAAGLVAHVNEHALGHVAVSGEAAGNGDLAALGVLGARFSALVGGGELVLERVKPLRPQGGEFCFALFDQ